MTDENACLVPQHTGPERYFVFTGKFGPKVLGLRNGARGPFLSAPHRAADDLTQRTHNAPSPQGQLNRVYPDAIEMRSAHGLGAVYGHIAVWMGVFLSGISGSFCVMLLTLLGEAPVFFLLPCLIVALPLFILSLLGVWAGVRILKWTPPDAPLLFNRRRREVTVFHASYPHFFKFWEKARTRYSTCTWDQIKVRTFKYLGSMTGGMRCSLYLAWGEPDNPSRFADYARMGEEGAGIDDLLFAMWEYVRRYMEEDGPAIMPGAELDSRYAKWPNPFPEDVIEAAGGQAYSLEEVQRMANQESEIKAQTG